MKDFEPYNNQDGFYGTGPARPPKSRSGILSCLLILVIFACGTLSALSFWKIQLFQQVDDTLPEAQSPLAFSSLSAGTASSDAAPANNGSYQMDIAQTPKATETVPIEGGLSLQQIYTDNIASVVSITCSQESGTTSGTGVVLSADGYIVTNCHVIENAGTVWVRFSDRRELTATVVGMDAMSDLAVLRVDANALKPAQFGDSDSVRVGDTVVAIGDPLGAQLSGTMTDGIISAINRDLTVGGRTMTLLQTNAALNSGNSGGPLINCYGQVIGINTMKLTGIQGELAVEGLGFAIPSRTVKDVVDQLIRQGYVSGRPTLGITGEEVTGLYKKYYDWPDGFYITQVTEGGAAEQAGIQPGDIITRFAGSKITTYDSLRAALFACQPGEHVYATICREGRYYQVVLTIGAVQ